MFLGYVFFFFFGVPCCDCVDDQQIDVKSKIQVWNRVFDDRNKQIGAKLEVNQTRD